MAHAALDALAQASPRDIIRSPDGGQRLLTSLYGTCRASGLTAAAAAEEVEQLHALFDVALDNGLGCAVVDYVTEVCGDGYLTSADPVEAYLLDGANVKRWAHRALQRTRARVLQGLAQGLADRTTAAALGREAGRLNSLVLVLEALAQPPADAQLAASFPSRTPQPVDESYMDLEDARRLQQTLKVVEWVVGQGVAAERPWGRFSSEQEWRSAMNKRRDGAAPALLFLQDLLSQLRQGEAAPSGSGAAAVAYPPASLEALLGSALLHGSTGLHAWHTKLSLLLYYFLDAGLPVSLDAFREGFAVPPVLVVQWQAQFLLDDAAGGPDAAASLEQASRILAGAGSAELPFRFIEALAARGRPEAALALQWARCPAPAGSQSPPPLQEAQTLLGIRLDCSLLTEAYLELRRHCMQQEAPAAAQHSQALLRQLLAWAQRNRALGPLLELPLSAVEEGLVVAWLQERVAAGDAAALFLPIMYLQRGRIPEALHAHAQLQASSVNGVDEAGARQLQAVLAAAARVLPAAQQHLQVHQAGQGLPALHIATSASAADAQLQRGVPLMKGLDAARSEQLATLHVAPQGGQSPPLLVSTLASAAALPQTVATAQNPQSPAAAPENGAPAGAATDEAAHTALLTAPPASRAPTRRWSAWNVDTGSGVKGFGGSLGPDRGESDAPEPLASKMPSSVPQHDWSEAMGLKEPTQSKRISKRARRAAPRRL